MLLSDSFHTFLQRQKIFELKTEMVIILALDIYSTVQS